MKNIEMKFDVKTVTIGDVIEQTVTKKLGESVERVTQYVTNLQDEQIRAALIKMGWTPPSSVVESETQN